MIHSPITAGGLVSEVLYESDLLGVHSRHKEFLSILCQTLSENPQRRDTGSYHTVSWSLWTILLQWTLYLSLSSVQRWLLLLEVSLRLAISLTWLCLDGTSGWLCGSSYAVDGYLPWDGLQPATVSMMWGILLSPRSCYRLQVRKLSWLLLQLGPAYLRYCLFRVNLFPHWVPIIVGSWWNAQHLWYLWLCSCSSLRSASPAA